MNENFYKARSSVVKFFDDYTSMTFEAKYKIIYGEGIKLLNQKEMLQKLLTAAILLLYCKCR